MQNLRTLKAVIPLGADEIEWAHRWNKLGIVYTFIYIKNILLNNIKALILLRNLCLLVMEIIL